MKLIKTGLGNFGIVSDAAREVIKAKDFRYILVTREGGRPGSLGGISRYEIKGTNDLEKLLDRKTFGDKHVEVTDTQSGEQISKEMLAQRYLASLSTEKKTALLDEVLLKHLMQRDS